MNGFRAERESRPTYEDVRWELVDEQYLAEVVAVVALGQARHAAALISAFEPMIPAFSDDQVRDAAVDSLLVTPGTADQEAARRNQRDGLLFEVLSWIALVETHVGPRFLIRDPHLGSTMQGLDGLLLELDEDTEALVRTVIVEDKCSERPRRTFQTKVLPAFRDHHKNRRAPALVASAAELLSHVFEPTMAVSRAAAVLDLGRRGYRASLAIEPRYDASTRRTRLFDGYDDLDGMPPENREGGGFVVGEDLRPWFESFAARVLAVLGRI